jgi:retron-type reverse transcriptase
MTEASATAPGLLARTLERAPAQIDRLAEETDGRYRVYPLTTGRRTRWIEAPGPTLGLVQRMLLDRLLYRLSPTRFAHGFVPGRSIVTNARRHCGSHVVVSMDIRDFFRSVPAEMVREALGALELSEADERRLVALVTRKGHLPQGAPTSPHLANLVSRRLDLRLAGLARALGWRYTRYADDLTFSGSGDPRRLVEAVGGIVRDEGFRVARRKTRIMPRHKRQSVTGLVVNDRVSVPRETRRLVRAALHNLRAGSPGDFGPARRARLAGYVAYLHQVEPDSYAGALEELSRLPAAEDSV